MAIDLSQLQEILSNAENSAAKEKEVRKSLTRIENLQASITHEIQHVYSLLDGAVEPKSRKPRVAKEPVEVDAEAPYGRKKDGSAKAKPGRSKEAEAAE